MFNLLSDCVLPVAAGQFVVQGSTQIESLPNLSNPVSATSWFLENYYSNSQHIIDYCLSIANGSISTDRFIPTSVKDLAVQVHEMYAGSRNPIPRPQNVN